MTKAKTSYCQNCITITDELFLEDYNEKKFWICLKCKFPLPRKSYDLGSKVSGKAWGEGLYKKRGTRNS
jgi:hypothetical protein